MEFMMVVAARGRGSLDLISRALHGDLEAISIIAGVAVVIVLAFYLKKIQIRNTGKKLADGLGSSTTFYGTPAGDRVWSIETQQQDMEFEIVAIKSGKQFHTEVSFFIPANIQWSEIYAGLTKFNEEWEGVDVEEYSGHVMLRFPGLGGDPTFCRNLMAGVSRNVQALQANPG